MKIKLNTISYLLYLCAGIIWCNALLMASEKKRASIFTAIDAPAATVSQEPTSAATTESLTPKESEQAKQQPMQTQEPEHAPQSEQPADGITTKKRKRRLLETLHGIREFETDGNGHVEVQVPAPEEPVVEAPEAKKAKPEPAAEEATIEFYFEDADIQTLLQQIKDLYNVDFITDSDLDPLASGGRALKGTKISFKTHKPLTRRAAWNLFLTFLDLAGFTIVPEPEPGIYRIVTFDKAQKMAVPVYIGVDSRTLPDNDQVIRYVYFYENADSALINDILLKLKSAAAEVVLLRDTKAFVITDKAYNIKSLMEIIRELDQVAMPQAMSVIKLQRADATDVKKLYDEITKPATPEAQTARVPTPRKPSSAIYFSENVRIIPEPRTNSLIVFGSVDGIKKVEDFVTKVVDIDLEKPYSPLHTYQLRYASATTVADIMNTVTNYGSKTPAGQTGGVRGGDKYLKPLTFTAEPATNTLVVKGDYEDFLKAVEVIKRLDEPQPQVAIEALIITIDWTTTKQLGTQLRNKVTGSVGKTVDFQTSGINIGGAPSTVVVREGDDVPGNERLLGNLINLAVGASAGNTVVSLGADNFGVWGIFGILETLTSAQVISNPFTITTNKTTAKVSIGEVRRVVSSTVFAGDNMSDAFDDMPAKLELTVTPQINTDGMIVLNVTVSTQDFLTAPTDIQAPALSTREITTKTIMSDREVIAIGGLIQNRYTDVMSKVPILGDIPILGWLFKNKSKIVEKNNLLVLLSTRIIAPQLVNIVDEYTENKLLDYYDTQRATDIVNNWRDPVDKAFFEPRKVDANDVVETFLIDRSKLVGKNITPIIGQKSKAAKKYAVKHKQEHGKYVSTFVPTEEPTPPPSPYAPAGMLEYLSREGKGTIKLTNNSTGRARRRRDARRSLQTGQSQGVMV